MTVQNWSSLLHILRIKICIFLLHPALVGLDVQGFFSDIDFDS